MTTAPDATASPATPETQPSMGQETTALSTAISLWRAGRAISLVLYAKLTEQGYDVPSLERFYRARKLP